MSRSKEKVKVLARCGALVLLLLPKQQIYSWEPDVHYGLTYWLAAKAGFEPRFAEILAGGDQGADEGKYNPAPWAVAHILIGKDVGASRAVQAMHFPSYGPVPGDPPERAVQPDSDAANRRAQQEIRTPIGTDAEEEYALRQFGSSLHPLQDSWSHQGEPDIPFRPIKAIAPRLSWGHPLKRDGWYSHNADLTCLHKRDAEETAAKTYALLQQYLKTHPQFGKPSKLSWNAIADRVQDFAKACSKAEKLDWFKFDPTVPFNEYGNQAFLSRLNVPGSIAPLLRDTRKSWTNSEDLVHGLPEWMDEIPGALRDAVHTFLVRWIVQNNIASALEFINIGDLAAQFEEFASQSEKTNQWARKFLSMWLAEDHGLVNLKGHGVPSAKGYDELPIGFEEGSPGFTKRKAYSSLEGALLAPGTEAPFRIVKVPTDSFRPILSYAVLFQFRDLPRDVIFLEFAQENQMWKIVRMWWVVL